jgi:hypothetical protein
MPTVPAVSQDMVARQIARAEELETDRGDLMEEIAANRDFLRLMDKNKELSDAQGRWLDTFYPLKEKGEKRSEDDIEATRKLKESTRKKVTAARKGN